MTKKELSEITEDEMPFDIPENWCWCRLGEISIFNGGYAFKSENYVSQTNGVRVLRISDFDENGIKEKNPVYYPYNSEMENYKLSVNDIIICMTGGTVGKSYLVKVLSEEMYVNQRVADIKCSGLVDVDYIYSVILSHHIQLSIQENKNSTNDNISAELIKKFLIPLPPLAEQKRIVAAIEKFMPLIEEYGKKETELKAFNEQIGTLTKKAILQEAVQGKLVPQIASEGNARDLLEEIKKEKAKVAGKASLTSFASKTRAKEFPPTTDDEIPFEIPESWCWCRLGEICNEIKRGKSPKYADKSNFLAFAQKCNVKTGGIDLGLALYLDENSITRYSETDNLVQGDIVINSTGGGTMGRVGLYETKVPAGIKGVYPDSHVTVIRSIGNINQHYLYYVLKLNQPVLEKCGTGSTNQTELKPAVLADFVIPLPPLAEQKRIVAAIEKMLPLCEKLGE